mmetsp:Transcript_64829/g.180453  ORF Transcript_64829/g.180453 Transcript_64829/m.180453 type:complete len:401 (-) Transcript_64829:266-1468(-)
MPCSCAALEYWRSCLWGPAKISSSLQSPDLCARSPPRSLQAFMACAMACRKGSFPRVSRCRFKLSRSSADSTVGRSCCSVAASSEFPCRGATSWAMCLKHKQHTNASSRVSVPRLGGDSERACVSEDGAAAACATYDGTAEGKSRSCRAQNSARACACGVMQAPERDASCTRQFKIPSWTFGFTLRHCMRRVAKLSSRTATVESPAFSLAFARIVGTMPPSATTLLCLTTTSQPVPRTRGAISAFSTTGHTSKNAAAVCRSSKSSRGKGASTISEAALETASCISPPPGSRSAARKKGSTRLWRIPVTLRTAARAGASFSVPATCAAEFAYAAAPQRWMRPGNSSSCSRRAFAHMRGRRSSRTMRRNHVKSSSDVSPAATSCNWRTPCSSVSLLSSQSNA